MKKVGSGEGLAFGFGVGFGVGFEVGLFTLGLGVGFEVGLNVGFLFRGRPFVPDPSPPIFSL